MLILRQLFWEKKVLFVRQNGKEKQLNKLEKLKADFYFQEPNGKWPIKRCKVYSQE